MMIQIKARPPIFRQFTPTGDSIHFEVGGRRGLIMQRVLRHDAISSTFGLDVTIQPEAGDDAGSVVAVLQSLADTVGAQNASLIIRNPGFPPSAISTSKYRCDGQHLTLLTSFDQRKRKHSSEDEWWLDIPNDVPGCSQLLSAFTGQKGAIFIVALSFALRDTIDRPRAEKAARRYRDLIRNIAIMCVEHQRRAVHIDDCHRALDRCDVGIVLLGANAEIVFENRTAVKLLDAGDYIRRKGQSVTGIALDDSVKLGVAVDHVITRRPSDETQTRVPVVALKQSSGGQPLLVCVISPHDTEIATNGTAAILYLFQPDRDISRSLNFACRLFHLSPVEAALACQLVAGASLSEAATALHVKELTARTYLKQIFSKTRVNRQAALVQLLLSNMIRLRDDLVLEMV
jgi:DNA-binding CsgD family transcriptional regulator/PAS domain-containing protein